MLKRACELLRRLQPTEQEDDSSEQGSAEKPILSKFDATRDLGGAFYAPGDWKEKHRELALALKGEFGVTFRDNGNSFNSCFQFEGQHYELPLQIRIKFYYKHLQLLQSESAAKAVGMNLKGIFYPNLRMGRTLKESALDGLCRIEITYTASTSAGEQELFEDYFPD